MISATGFQNGISMIVIQRDGSQVHEHECHILCKRPLSTLTRVLGRIINRCRYFDGNTAYDEVEPGKRRWEDLMDRKLHLRKSLCKIH